MTKRVVVIAMGIMSTLLLLALLWQFRIVVIYVLISLLLAATFRPTPRDGASRPPIKRIQLVFRYVAAVGLFILFISSTGRFLANDVQELVQNVTEQTTWMLPAWLQDSALERSVASLPTPNQVLLAFTSQRELVLETLLGFTEGLGGVLSGLLVILFLSVYWGLNQNHFERLWLSLLPAEIRRRARYISRAVQYELGAYTRSEVIQSALAAILLGLGYWLIGSPYPALLAIVGALVRLVPVIGFTVSLVLPFLLGSLTSTPLGVTSMLYTALVLSLLHLWVEPRLFKPNQDNPVLTFVILLAMADAFGLAGIIAAPPVSIICQTLWRYLVAERISETGSQVMDLKQRYARLQDAIDAMVGTPPPLVVSSMQRLTNLIEKAEPVLDGKQQQEASNLLRDS